MAKKDYNDEDGVWRTIGGRKVFIRKGQNLADAMIESGKFKTKGKMRENYRKEKAKDEKEEELGNAKAEEEIDKGYTNVYDALKDKNKNKSNNDYKYDYKDGILSIKGKDGEELASYGVSKENYKESPQYWKDRAKQELNEELSYLMKDAEKEFKDNATFNTDYLHKEKGMSYKEIQDMSTDDYEKQFNEWKNNRNKSTNDYKVKSGNPIEDMANDRVKEKQNTLQMNKMLLENMNKNNIDKLPDGTTKDDLEFKVWENQKYIDTANNNFENLKKNTISEAEKEKYMKDNNLTMFTSRDEYNYLKNKANQSTNETKPLASNSGQERINDNTKVMNYGGTYIVTQNGANKGEFESQKEAEDFAKSLSTNETMNNAIREKASKKTQGLSYIDSKRKAQERKYSADEQDILDRYGEDYGYDKGDNLKNLKGQIDYMRIPSESIHKTAERLVEGGDFLIYNEDIKDWLKERNIKFNDDDFFDKYKKVMADDIERLYNKANNQSFSDSIRKQATMKDAYKQYLKDHPESKMSLSQFRNMKK